MLEPLTDDLKMQLYQRKGTDKWIKWQDAGLRENVLRLCEDHIGESDSALNMVS